jgi:hypothetical protein
MLQAKQITNKPNQGLPTNQRTKALASTKGYQI